MNLLLDQLESHTAVRKIYLFRFFAFRFLVVYKRAPAHKCILDTFKSSAEVVVPESSVQIPVSQRKYIPRQMSLENRQQASAGPRSLAEDLERLVHDKDSRSRQSSLLRRSVFYCILMWLRRSDPCLLCCWRECSECSFSIFPNLGWLLCRSTS